MECDMRNLILLETLATQMTWMSSCHIADFSRLKMCSFIKEGGISLLGNRDIDDFLDCIPFDFNVDLCCGEVTSTSVTCKADECLLIE